MKQTTSFTNYVTKFDQQLAVCKTHLEDVVKKSLLLRNMRVETKEQIYVKPEILEQTYKIFCESAAHIDDSFYRLQIMHKKKQVGSLSVNTPGLSEREGATVGAVNDTHTRGNAPRKGALTEKELAERRKTYVNPFEPPGSERFKDYPLDFCYAWQAPYHLVFTSI